MFKIGKLIVVSSFLALVAATGCAVDDGSTLESQVPRTQTDQDTPDPADCAEVADHLTGDCGFRLGGMDENDLFLACDGGAFSAEELRCLRSAPCGKIADICFGLSD